MDPYADVVDSYADFEASARDYSPCFAEWARAVIEDPEVQAWLADLPRLKQQPNLVFAAARWHGVAAPGPYAGLREALLNDDGRIRQTILSRSTQTNEVGRLATLTPAFATIAGSEPVALLEVGASAGLCLYPDRYSYAWSTGSGTLTAGAGPLLECRVEGRLPDPLGVPPVAWRSGVDLNPLDVADADEMAWLATLVWPEHDDRRQRLQEAVEVTRREPPRLVRGDLLAELPGLVEEAGRHGRVIVFHSAVIAYLDDERRRQFADLMTDLVATGTCHGVSNEAPRLRPGGRATAPDPPAPPVPPMFVLGIDGRAVAWTDGHGRSMTWFGASS